MFEDIIKKDKTKYQPDKMEYIFPNGTVTIDFDKKRVILKDKFSNKEFLKVCEKIYTDLGEHSPVKPTDDGKWYKLADGYVSFDVEEGPPGLGLAYTIPFRLLCGL